MPDEAPERVLDTVLDQIDHTPQALRARLAGRWRFTVMTRPILAGAAAVLAVAIGAFALLPRPSSSPGVTPSSAPSASATASSIAVQPSASPSQVASGVPSALQHRWMGEPNGLAPATVGSSILFTAGSLAIGEPNRNDHALLTANAAAVGGQLQVTTGGAVGRCDPGASGTYDYRLSADGLVLTITTATDPCAARSDALAGTWWSSVCKDPNDNCLGTLAAGTYKSQFINFANPGPPTWVADFGAVTYTVPDGWANDADWPAHLALSPAASYANWTAGVGTDRGIDVYADIRASNNNGGPCSGQLIASTGPDPARIVEYVRTIKGLVATAASPVTIDGRTGVQVDLGVDDAKLVPCGSDRVVEYLISAGEGLALLPGERMRLIVLPDGDRAIAIDVLAPAAAFDAVVAQSMPIIQSMHFK
jgi:hypothetical protein